MKKKVTIGFPIFNVQDYVRESLLSVLKQTYENIEIIIINDNSNDNSLKIINQLLNENNNRQYNVIIVENERRIGIGNVRNQIIDLASGEFLFFLDSDDKLEYDTINKMIGITESYQVDFVAGSHIDSNNKVFAFSDDRYIESESVLNYAVLNNIRISNYMWNKLYNISFLRKNKIFCEQEYVEDDLFIFKVNYYAKSCYLLCEITYKYTIRADSITRSIMTSKDLPLKTAAIYRDIFFEKYKIIDKILIRNVKEKCYYKVVGESIFKLFQVLVSTEIKKDNKEKMIIEYLDYPKMNPRISKNSAIHNFKYIYYSILSIMPFKIKKYVIQILNFSYYKAKK